MGKETAGWYVVTDLIWFGLVCWGKNHCPHVQFPPNADNQPTHDRHLVLLVFEWSYEFNVFHLKKKTNVRYFIYLLLMALSHCKRFPHGIIRWPLLQEFRPAEEAWTAARLWIYRSCVCTACSRSPAWAEITHHTSIKHTTRGPREDPSTGGWVTEITSSDCVDRHHSNR